MMTMRRVVVTGGAGFVGSHLTDLLAGSGADVLVVDDFRLGQKWHLEGALATGRVSVLEADVRSPAELRPVTDFEPDAVFHLAALHYLPYCDAHPQEAFDVNVLGLDAVLRVVRGSPLESLVFASSAAVYGFSDEPWKESGPLSPHGPYGISKWMGEQLLERFHADRPEIRAAGARLFNVYGPGDQPPRASRHHGGTAVPTGRSRSAISGRSATSSL